MDAAPPTRRRLAPTTSLPSTAEEQAQRHGIPGDISAALQGNVGMRIRQAVGAGRDAPFGRTQSQPVLPFGQPQSSGSTSTSVFGGQSSHFTSTPTNGTSGGGFATHRQIMDHAQGIISREALRQRELRPYSSNESIEVSALDLADGRRGDDGRRLKFGNDGEVLMEGETTAQGQGRGQGRREMSGREQAAAWIRLQGRKRAADDAQVGESGGGGDDGGDTDAGSDTGTEIDEDEDIASGAHFGGTSGANDFPAVFASPDISHPALFQRTTSASAGAGVGAGAGSPSRTTGTGTGTGDGRMPPPPIPLGRRTKALPARGAGFGKGRVLGKTVSAPVRLGGAGGMDVDMDDGNGAGDGFDVSEWAGKADF